uniref:PH domain-containing protein n=1 Tax=Macrostomum lignano TaxID=282301 RepID=A0A1I8F8A4_9PLAT
AETTGRGAPVCPIFLLSQTSTICFASVRIDLIIFDDCRLPTAQPVGRRGGGGGGGCSIGASGLPGVSGIVMEQHESLRLKRSRGGSSMAGATPSGMSPGGIPSQTAASATAAPASAVVAAAAGGAGRARHQQQQKASRCHFTFDFSRGPTRWRSSGRRRLQRKFREKLGAQERKIRAGGRVSLGRGVILTERRRKILARYYRRGQQEVLLYVDRSEFEYYTPVCCCQPLNSPNWRLEAGREETQRQGQFVYVMLCNSGLRELMMAPGQHGHIDWIFNCTDF